jgi:large subunit ribosomal protein L10
MPSVRTLERNRQKIEELSEIFSNNGVYLFDYRGLTVKEMQDLRNKVKPLDANVKVIKNRLAIRYFEEKNQNYGRDLFSGPLAVVYADEKYVEVARVMADFEKESKKIKLKSGFIEKKLIDKNQVLSVAKLPGKDQLLSQLAFSIAMPLKKMGMALSAPLTNILILLKNLKDKKEKEGEQNG